MLHFLLIFVLLTLSVNKMLLNVWVTPYSVMVIPFIGVFYFLYFFGDRFDFYEVGNDAFLLIFFGFAAFWAGQWMAILSLLSTQKTISTTSLGEVTCSSLSNALYIFLFVAIAVSIVSYGKVVVSHGFAAFGSEVVGKSTGSGLLAHLRSLSYPCAVILFVRFVETRSLGDFLSSMLCLLSLFACMTKYHAVFALLTIGFFILLYQKKNVLLVLFVSMAGSCLLFGLNYMVGIVARGTAVSMERIQWILTHMSGYLVGGVVALNGKLNDVNYHAAFEGVWKFFFVTMPRAITSRISFLDLLYDREFVEIGYEKMTNIGTLFYDIYNNSGLSGVIFWMIVAGFLSSMFFFLSMNSSSLMGKLAVSHMLAVLFLSFFSNYFVLLAPLEYLVMLALVVYLASHCFLCSIDDRIVMVIK